MSRSRSASFHHAQKTFQPPSRMDWTDEKLAGLDTPQLKSLLQNLRIQRESGRVTDETAEDLTRRITARLPASALTVRRTRPRALALLDARIAASLGGLANALSQRYDLSEETARLMSVGIAGFKPQAATDKRGLAKTGSSVKNGNMAIDRFIAYRVRDSLASLAYLLGPDEPQEKGRYVILATSDLLEAGVPIAEVMPASRDYGWSRESRERMRAQTVENYAEAQKVYESLIARVATKRLEEE